MATQERTRSIIFIALFSALIAAGAYIKIPAPTCPITLQTFFVALAGILLGGKKGAISVLVYVIIGLIGVPIFTSGGGISYVFQPTFGYIIGFVPAAYVTGKIAHSIKSPSVFSLYIAAIAGLVFTYAIGVTYFWAIVTFYTGKGIATDALLLSCLVLPLPGDLVMSFIAATVSKRISYAERLFHDSK